MLWLNKWSVNKCGRGIKAQVVKQMKHLWDKQWWAGFTACPVSLMCRWPALSRLQWWKQEELPTVVCVSWWEETPWSLFGRNSYTAFSAWQHGAHSQQSYWPFARDPTPYSAHSGVFRIVSSRFKSANCSLVASYGLQDHYWGGILYIVCSEGFTLAPLCPLFLGFLPTSLPSSQAFPDVLPS